MEKNLVGYRFHPTGEELINYYLKNKIGCRSWLVDEAISEINILSFEPDFLPSLSKIVSEDLVWYFFTRLEFANAKKNSFKRTTPCGFWKPTGKDRSIKVKGGKEIGITKSLVYHQGRVPNGIRTPWIMHEYHITCLPLNQRTHVICKVMYNGEDSDISVVSGSVTATEINTPLEVEQPVQEDDYMSLDDFSVPITEQAHLSPNDRLGFNPEMLLNDINNQQQSDIHYYDEFVSNWLNGGGILDVEVPNLDLIFQQHHNEHKPKKALSGYISNDSDSEAESMFAMSQDTSSPGGDSVGSSNRYFLSCLSTDAIKDLKNHESQLSRCIIPSKQKVKKGKSRAIDVSMRKELSSMVKVEKKSWLVTEEAIVRNHKNPSYIYLMNMIIGFILLLNLIGNIIQNIKTSIH